MAGLLEAIFGEDTDTVEQVRRHTGNDPKRAEQAYSPRRCRHNLARLGGEE